MSFVAKEYCDYIIGEIKNSKDKAIELDCVSLLLKDRYGSKYDPSEGINSKYLLRNSEELSFYNEGDHFNEEKCYYSTGNWLAEKGRYDNVVKMKQSIGIAMWETKCKNTIVDNSLC